MNIQLINGDFSKADAKELITKLLSVKVKFHEDKITQDSSEEEMKFREKKIIALNNELAAFKKNIENEPATISMHSIIEINS